MFGKKRTNRFLLFIGLCLSMTIGQANAGLIPTGVGNVLLDVDTSGAEPSLLGARNIDVFGTGELYDVNFVDGSFRDIFVDESGLDIGDLATARVFGRALLDFVLINLPFGNFDTRPEFTQGCEDSIRCVAFIPYEIVTDVRGTTSLDFASTSNGFEVEFDSPFGVGFGSLDLETLSLANATFADFSLSSPLPAQAVPEPPTVVFMTLIMTFFVWNRRKRATNTNLHARTKSF
jgi:hypothetical protein